MGLYEPLVMIHVHAGEETRELTNAPVRQVASKQPEGLPDLRPASDLSVSMLSASTNQCGAPNHFAQQFLWRAQWQGVDASNDSRNQNKVPADAVLISSWHANMPGQCSFPAVAVSTGPCLPPQHGKLLTDRSAFGAMTTVSRQTVCMTTSDARSHNTTWGEHHTSSPSANSFLATCRVPESRSNNGSPFSSYSSSPRSADFKVKRNSSGTAGVNSPRTPPLGTGGHRMGIDPRLVVGSPLEVAWEVLHNNPGLAGLLNMQPGTARLRNLPVQEDEDADSSIDSSAAAKADTETLLTPQQLVHEQGLVRSCRGLPARVRDDLIKAARLAVTRNDGNALQQPGTGLLPFFWRVQSNLKWLLQQPATLKGQLLPGQIDCITEEQRSLSFLKTVQQRKRLGELAVMLHCLLQESTDSSTNSHTHLRDSVPGGMDAL